MQDEAFSFLTAYCLSYPCGHMDRTSDLGVKKTDPTRALQNQEPSLVGSHHFPTSSHMCLSCWRKVLSVPSLNSGQQETKHFSSSLLSAACRVAPLGSDHASFPSSTSTDSWPQILHWANACIGFIHTLQQTAHNSFCLPWEAKHLHPKCKTYYSSETVYPNPKTQAHNQPLAGHHELIYK